MRANLAKDGTNSSPAGVQFRAMRGHHSRLVRERGKAMLSPVLRAALALYCKSSKIAIVAATLGSAGSSFLGGERLACAE